MKLLPWRLLGGKPSTPLMSIGVSWSWESSSPCPNDLQGEQALGCSLVRTESSWRPRMLKGPEKILEFPRCMSFPYAKLPKTGGKNGIRNCKDDQLGISRNTNTPSLLFVLTGNIWMH